MNRNCCLKKYSCIFQYSSSLTILCLKSRTTKILNVDESGFSRKCRNSSFGICEKNCFSMYAVMHHLLFIKMQFGASIPSGLAYKELAA